jgi:hypothetical protein
MPKVKAYMQNNDNFSHKVGIIWLKITMGSINTPQIIIFLVM